MKNSHNSSNSKPLFTVDSLPTQLFQQRDNSVGKVDNSGKSTEELSIASALKTILRQMKVAGNSVRTIADYERHTVSYAKATGHILLSEISVDSIYLWLDSMGNVQNSTKLIRLKSFKAVLGRCFQNGWLPTQFWTQVTVKVDEKVKKPATEEDVMRLLSVMDLSNFFEMRDATAILLMFKTGIRLRTISDLEERHVDLEGKYLNLSGDIMKNHASLKLPISDDLATLLHALMVHNDLIRERRNTENTYIFITANGTKVQRSLNNNVLQKRIKKYSDEYNIKNINPHSLRRGFAVGLLNKNAPINLISKALHHSSLEVTSKYLNLDNEQVAQELKEYL